MKEGILMKIALINENSQADKNQVIFNTLNQVCQEKKYELYNLGMTSGSDPNLTYVQNGLMAAILLNSNAVDFVVTGCGTGEGAMLALNSFPNVECGLINDATDAYLFSQINAGNAISIPFAKGFGWGSELTLTYLFEKLFANSFGGGYPVERREKEQENKKILDNIKKITHKDMMTVLKEVDYDFLVQTINRDNFLSFFLKEAPSSDIKNYIEKVVKDIQSRLNFREENVFRMSFERKNLAYIVRKTDNKTKELLYILQRISGSAIIYVRNRRRTKEITELLNNEDITIYGDGKQTRSFQYIDDLIEGMVRMMDTEDDFTGPINIGNPNEFPVLELAERVIRMTGSTSKIVFKPLPTDDPKQRQPDIKLAKEKLGWQPTVELEDGLKRMIEYFKNV